MDVYKNMSNLKEWMHHLDAKKKKKTKKSNEKGKKGSI